MKMLKLLLASCLSCLFALGAQGQSQEDEQLLIFRKSGEVNLLHSLEIDSITMTCIDTLGIQHDLPIAQVFHAQDTTLYVELAEIDSVCFGSRNEIEFRDDVRIMTRGNDESWIIRFENNTIYYRVDTPADVMPAVGMKLFYPELTEMFPMGLSSIVENIERTDSEIAVRIRMVSYDEIFSKLFYAGGLNGMSEAMAQGMRKAHEIDRREPIELTIPFGGDAGEFKLNGYVWIKGDVVISKATDFYSANVSVECSLGRELRIKTKKVEKEWKLTSKPIPLPSIPSIPPIICPSISFGLFLEADAEASLVLSETYKKTVIIDWKYNKGKHQMSARPSQAPDANASQVKNEAVFSGTAFMGLEANLDFTLVGVAGARLKAKIGPEIAGSLGYGTFAELSKKGLTSGIYGSLELTYVNKMRFEGRGLFFGNESKTNVSNTVLLSKPKNISLVPTLSKTIAVKSGNAKPGAPRHIISSTNRRVEGKEGSQLLSVSTKATSELSADIETGFQMVNNKGDVLDSVFVDQKILGDKVAVQGISATFSQPASIGLDTVSIRPVIHYAGYTLPYEKAHIAQDPNIQPVISFGTNGAVTYISGTPIVATTRIDSTVAHIGPDVPVAVYDKVFHPDSSPYCDVEGKNFPTLYQSIIGSWNGQEDETQLILTFKEDGTGKYQEGESPERDLTYQINSPQTGSIAILFADDELSILVYRIEALTSSQMSLSRRNSSTNSNVFVLLKQ